MTVNPTTLIDQAGEECELARRETHFGRRRAAIHHYREAENLIRTADVLRGVDQTEGYEFRPLAARLALETEMVNP